MRMGGPGGGLVRNRSGVPPTVRSVLHFTPRHHILPFHFMLTYSCTASVMRRGYPCARLVLLVAAFAITPSKASEKEEEGIIRTSENDADETVMVSTLPESIVRLNSRIFHGNVLSGNEHTQNWIVVFCPSWWAPCQQMERNLPTHAGKWQDELNEESVVNLRIRFASVDCATDKPLCNEQGVKTYPTVVHYQGGKHGAVWTGNGRNDDKRFGKWLEERLGSLRSPQAPSAPVLGVKEALQRSVGSVPLPQYSMDFAIVAVAVMLVAFSVARNPDMKQKLAPAATSVPLSPALNNELSAHAVSESENAVTLMDESVGQVTAKVARVLPGEWWTERKSMEL